MPEVMDVYFKSPFVWPQIAEISTGTNVRRRRLHPKAFLNYNFPVPPMETQLTLRAVEKKVSEISKTAGKASKELNKLYPAILNKAFNGEL